MQDLVQTQIHKDLLNNFTFVWDLNRSLSGFNARFGFSKQLKNMHVAGSIQMYMWWRGINSTSWTCFFMSVWGYPHVLSSLQSTAFPSWHHDLFYMDWIAGKTDHLVVTLLNPLFLGHRWSFDTSVFHQVHSDRILYFGWQVMYPN